MLTSIYIQIISGGDAEQQIVKTIDPVFFFAKKLTSTQ